MKIRSLKGVVAWLLIALISFSMTGCSSTDTLAAKSRNVSKAIEGNTTIEELESTKIAIAEHSSDSVSNVVDREKPMEGLNENSADPIEASSEETTEPTSMEKAALIPAADDTSLEDELKEIESMETDSLSPTQRNAINMLNYMTVLTQEIIKSQKSRIFLDTVYNSLTSNTHPNAVDPKSQAQINSILNTLHQYQMISVKRERLEYIYEQNQAQALRQAIPDPIGLLNVVQSGSLLKAVTSVIYMAVDSVTSYEYALNQADLQYLKDGWELDDAEKDEVHKSRTTAFDYLVSMVQGYSLPGDYALSSEAINNFVEWKNKTNLVSKTAWLEGKYEAYKEFGPYWLELAKCYYESNEYKRCIEAFDEYEKVTTRIFRIDTDYAEALPMAIISAKEIMSPDDYVVYADKHNQIIMLNINDSDWTLRFFVAQINIDLYKIKDDRTYLDKAYKIALENVNVLVDEQKNLNAAYLADIKEEKVEAGATKQQKEDVKQYNKMLKEQRKVELPPISEALFLNCDLLFSLVTKRGISEREQRKIDAILHENGQDIFLTTALDERFRFSDRRTDFDTSEVDVKFTGQELRIPVSCITNNSMVSVIVLGESRENIIDDWTVQKVERPNGAGYSEFIATFASDIAKKYKYTVGDKIIIRIVPIAHSPNELIEFTYEAVGVKKLFFIDGIAFDRK